MALPETLWEHACFSVCGNPLAACPFHPPPGCGWAPACGQECGRPGEGVHPPPPGCLKFRLVPVWCVCLPLPPPRVWGRWVWVFLPLDVPSLSCSPLGVVLPGVVVWTPRFTTRPKPSAAPFRGMRGGETCIPKRLGCVTPSPLLSLVCGCGCGVLSASRVCVCVGGEGPWAPPPPPRPPPPIPYQSDLKSSRITR